MSEEPTTPDLVELERLGWAALNRGDLGRHLKADVTMDFAGYGMGTSDGREAATGFLEDWISSFEDLTIVTRLVIYWDGGRALVDLGLKD